LKRGWQKAVVLLTLLTLWIPGCVPLSYAVSSELASEGPYEKLLSSHRWAVDLIERMPDIDPSTLIHYVVLGESRFELNGDGSEELFFAAIDPNSWANSGSGYPDMFSFLYTLQNGVPVLVAAVQMTSDAYARGSLIEIGRQRSPRREVVIIDTAESYAGGGESNKSAYYRLEGARLVKITEFSATIRPKSHFPAEKVRKGLPWTYADFSFFPAYPGWDDPEDPYVIVWEKDGAVASAKSCLSAYNRFLFTGQVNYTFINNYFNGQRTPALPAEEQESLSFYDWAFLESSLVYQPSSAAGRPK